jgi:hypothetical protein
MKLGTIHQQAIQARMSLIVGAQNFDRLFLGAVFEKIADRILYVFARTEGIATEIEERFALHLAIVASQITSLPVEFVEVHPHALRQPNQHRS